MVNLNTTYRAHDSAHNFASSVSGAVAESQHNIGALQAQMAVDTALVNRENTDGGKIDPGTGGAINMLAQAVSKYGGTALGIAGMATAGPIGIGMATAGLAIDLGKFMTGGKSAEPENSGGYLKASYEKMTRGGAYRNAKDDPIVCEGYSDSSGGYTDANGRYCEKPAPQQFQQQPAKAPAFAQRAMGEVDASELAAARKRLVGSADMLADNQDQLYSTIGQAQKRGMDMSRGTIDQPKPPSMAGMGPMV